MSKFRGCLKNVRIAVESQTNGLLGLAVCTVLGVRNTRGTRAQTPSGRPGPRGVEAPSYARRGGPPVRHLDVHLARARGVGVAVRGTLLGSLVTWLAFWPLPPGLSLSQSLSFSDPRRMVVVRTRQTRGRPGTSRRSPGRTVPVEAGGAMGEWWGDCEGRGKGLSSDPVPKTNILTRFGKSAFPRRLA